MNDKYLQYQIEDFVADDSFVGWVISAENDHEWRSWFELNKDQAQRAQEARQMILSLKFKEEVVDDAIKRQIWKQIDNFTQAKTIPMKPVRSYLRYIIGTAAAAILAFIIFMNVGNIEQLSNIADEPLIAMLPSESKVELIGHTTVSYNKRKWKEERRIKLDGEAIFDVTKGVPFVVETDNGYVRVLGTKFKVVSRGSTFYVVVESGRVEVVAGEDKEVLTASQNFVKTQSVQSELEVPIKLPESTSTSYHFQRETLDEVLQMIESNYGVQVRHELDGDRLYTGSFKSTDSLAQVLDALSWTMGLGYEIDGYIIILTDEQ